MTIKLLSCFVIFSAFATNDIQGFAESGILDSKLNRVLHDKFNKKILLLDVRFTYYVDFVNNNIQRLGPKYSTWSP